MVRVAALMVVAFVAVTACVAQVGAPSARTLPLVPAAASVAFTASPASQPSGGIPQAQAIELARDHTSFTNFVSASAGPFRDLNIQPGVGPGFPIKPNQIVWAVTFSGDVTICSPVGTCFSPRPGIIAVYLDVLTGDFLSSATNAPAPQPAPTGRPGPDPSLTCSLPPQDCNDALQAIEVLPALDANGMPPVAVAIVGMSECRTVSGAPQGYAPCAAAMSPPADLSATGSGDALATVTYRNGRGKALLWLYWWTYASGRGPINAILQAHNP